MLKQLRETSKIKLILAATGVLTIVVVVAGGVAAVVTRPVSKVSELALHPERQDEILARREADGYRTQLGLSEDQTTAVADLLLASRKRAIEARAAASSGGPQAMMSLMRDRSNVTEAIRELLTPEQQKVFDESPAGKRLQMMKIMRDASPEERENFRQQMQDRIPGGPGGFPGGGRGLPRGFPSPEGL